MINIKKCRREFLSLLNNLYNINDDKYHKQISHQLTTLKKYIDDEYFYDKELPKISHLFISKIQQELEDIETLFMKYFVSKGYDLPNDMKNDSKNLINKASLLINEYSINDKISKTNSANTGFNDVLYSYSNVFGKENIIKALQCGIDIFCKERKHLFKPQKINITGVINDNFLNLMNTIIKIYPIDIIERYLVKGLKSNLIFETKDLKNINTKELINKINEISKRRIYG